MATPTLQQRLQAARAQMVAFDNLRKEAFQPAPAMPQGAPPMQGGPPMDPSMQGAPPMQGGPPMDPQQQAMMEQQMMAQQGGAPPMDPSMQGPPPIPPEQLEEMMTLMEQMGQGLTQAMERIDGLEAALQELAPQVEEATATLQSVMQGAAQEPQPAGGW